MKRKLLNALAAVCFFAAVLQPVGLDSNVTTVAQTGITAGILFAACLLFWGLAKREGRKWDCLALDVKRENPAATGPVIDIRSIRLRTSAEKQP